MSAFPKEALTPVVGLPGKEMSQADIDYTKAMEEIKASLDRRNGLDPSMLALAQGFLSPTKTGGFGESLGNAVANYIPAQQAEDKRIQENAGLRLQLAQAGREQEQSTAAMKYLQGRGKGAPAAGEASGGPTVEFQGKTFTPEDISVIKIGNPKLGKILEEELKLKLDMIATQPGGIVNKLEGTYKPFGGKATVQRIIPGVGKIDMPEEDAMSLDEARRTGNATKYWGIVDSVTKPMGRAPVAGAAATPVSDERTTASSLEAEAAAAKTRAEKMAGSEAERTNLVMDSAKAARGATAGYTRANEILTDKDVQKSLGILSKGDVTSALGNLVNEAFRVGNYSVGIPSIKKILTESGAPQNVIDKLAELGQIEAMWQMEQRKGLGAGTSVSNMEQMMANRVTPSQDDPYNAYVQKLKFLQEKAKFDIELSKALKRSKMTYDQFEDTKEFDGLFNGYQSRLMNIVTPGGAATAPAAQPSTGSITAGSLRQRLTGKP
jgi:hypothetical protein